MQPLSRTPILCQKLDPSVWPRIEEQLLHEHLGHSQIVYDRDSDWFFIRLDNVRLDQSGADVEIEFNDTRNDNWKVGIIWDFVEMREHVRHANAVA